MRMEARGRTHRGLGEPPVPSGSLSSRDLDTHEWKCAQAGQRYHYGEVSHLEREASGRTRAEKIGKGLAQSKG